MSELIVIAADTPEAAFELRDRIAEQARDFAVEVEDIVVVSRAEDDAVRLHTRTNTVAMQALGGGVWGLGLGAVLLMPLVGAAVGAAAGALTGRAPKIGIDDGFLREIGRALAPGSAAVAVLARRVDAYRLAAIVRTHGGEVLHAALSDEVADAMPPLVTAKTPTKREVHVAGYGDQPPL